MRVVKSESLSTGVNHRWIVIDEETGEILDDAQGYGYKSKQKAYNAYFYKQKRKENPGLEELYLDICGYLYDNQHIIRTYNNMEISAWESDTYVRTSDVSLLIEGDVFLSKYEIRDVRYVLDNIGVYIKRLKSRRKV